MPLDLVAAQCRAAGRVARGRLSGRLRDAMAGYLVSDCCADDAALRALEMAGAAAFSERRAGYELGIDAVCVSGARVPMDVSIADCVAGGPLDAVDWIAAGACEWFGFRVEFGQGVAVRREGGAA